MDSYTTIWTNQNDNYSCIDPAFLPYNLIEQNPRKDLSNKMLNTALSGQMKKAYVTPDQSPRYYPKFVTKEEREAVVLRRRQLEAEQTATKDDRTGRPSTSSNS
ncbi:unnamed protein product [Rotaria sp. Silwood2]|nr:unnamed protein product [Rotaria sp. Silwood2]